MTYKCQDCDADLAKCVRLSDWTDFACTNRDWRRKWRRGGSETGPPIERHGKLPAWCYDPTSKVRSYMAQLAVSEGAEQLRAKESS